MLEIFTDAVQDSAKDEYSEQDKENMKPTYTERSFHNWQLRLENAMRMVRT